MGLIAGESYWVSLLMVLLLLNIIAGLSHFRGVSLLVYLILGGSHCWWISLCLIVAGGVSRFLCLHMIVRWGYEDQVAGSSSRRSSEEKWGVVGRN